MRLSVTALLLGLWLSLTTLANPAAAVSLIRDADIENALDELAAPILRAAGLNPNRMRILVVNDSSLNAFVISNDVIFMHSGLLLRLESAAQVQAVIAHEAAHIVNGHILSLIHI